MVKSAAWAAPQPGSCASSGHAWRLWAAQHSQEEAEPLGAQPLPRALEPAASEAADFPAFGDPGNTPSKMRQPKSKQLASILHIADFEEDQFRKG